MIKVSRENNFASHMIVIAVVGESVIFQVLILFRVEVIYGGLGVRVKILILPMEVLG